ncbi:F0F1 ATP synthase subunit gamma [Fulvimarina pelagi HTCC2506]|uniref:ATP synthase gamma chain n=2 Tax=Fulvimarina pelagi TaxID=217511 RepID=Q0G1M0_9HYPH|nr:F0F1 ATP synthase subunit gamma [Fulvimarina pelagi]EAU41061.1 F0F1 ATP synthase subunit gamma [Fulvimarina pelagi HTCC2506]BAT30925.1 F0F1 ATP synthase subunit gamma [Fulvimarina pelagi]
MASLKDLRNRISSVKSTKKITKAMQMVAASKLRRAEEAAQNARPYAERMHSVLSNLAGINQNEAPKLMTGTGKDDVHLLVVFTADRGLCGGFNASIVKKARAKQRELEANGKSVKFYAVGKKGYDLMRRDLSDKIVDSISFRESSRVGFDEAAQVGDKVIDMFEAGEFDVCHLFYAEFENVMTQVPTGQQVIPASVEEDEDGENEKKGSDAGTTYEYEPDPAGILDDLIPRNIKIQILRALLENAASEQGARMTAMDSATRNAGDMIEKLEISYNRQRQAQITTELTEIISGAEAL